MDEKYIKLIAWRNDWFRYRGQRIWLSEDVKRMACVSEIVYDIRLNGGNSNVDPHFSEHDSGVVVWYGKKICWHISYRNRFDQQYYCNPLSLICKRVLEVWVEGEYDN